MLLCIEHNQLPSVIIGKLFPLGSYAEYRYRTVVFFSINLLPVPIVLGTPYDLNDSRSDIENNDRNASTDAIRSEPGGSNQSLTCLVSFFFFFICHGTYPISNFSCTGTATLYLPCWKHMLKGQGHEI